MKFDLLENLEVGDKFKVINIVLTKTNRIGVEYRIECVDEKGNKHYLKRETPVMKCIK